MDKYKPIITEILKNQREGYQIEGLFREASQQEVDYLKNLMADFVNKSEIYKAEELDSLISLSLPQKIIDFYRSFLPLDNITLKNGVILLTIENMQRENLEFAPGAYLIKYGLLTFASTIGGNALCLDLNEISSEEPSVIIADHSIFDGPVISIFDDDEFKEFELCYETIKKFTNKIADTFTEFLSQMARNQFDEVEDYIAH